MNRCSSCSDGSDLLHLKAFGLGDLGEGSGTNLGPLLILGVLGYLAFTAMREDAAVNRTSRRSRRR